MKRIIFILTIALCLPVLSQAQQYSSLCTYPADTDANCKISSTELSDYRQYHQQGLVTLKELLRTVQFYNMSGYTTNAVGSKSTEDGYTPILAEAKLLQARFVNTSAGFLRGQIKINLKSISSSKAIDNIVVLAHWTNGTNNLPATITKIVTGANKNKNITADSRIALSGLPDGNYYLIIDKISYTVDGVESFVNPVTLQTLKTGTKKVVNQLIVAEADDNKEQLASIISSLESLLADLKTLVK